MILVVGGTGKVGSDVVRALVDAGKKVRVLTRNPEAARLYEQMGFARSAGTPDHTHVLELW